MSFGENLKNKVLEMTKRNGTKFLPHNSISSTFWTIFFTENIRYPFNIFPVIGTWGTKYLNRIKLTIWTICAFWVLNPQQSALAKNVVQVSKSFCIALYLYNSCYFQTALIRLKSRRMVTAMTGLVMPGKQRYFGAKVAARTLSFYCQSFCRRSNQKKCYKHVALE